jgi:hypothetical protein
MSSCGAPHVGTWSRCRQCSLSVVAVWAERLLLGALFVRLHAKLQDHQTDSVTILFIHITF